MDSSSSRAEGTVLTPEDFKSAFRHHPAGVAIVTADDGDGPVAMTVSSLVSVSAEPPTLAFSASALSSSTPTVLSAKTVVVHFIGAEDVELAKLCAQSGTDRFPEGSWARLGTGEPYYPSVAVWIRGEIVERVEVFGSHLCIVRALGAGIVAETERAPRPIVYHNRGWYRIDEAARAV